MRASMWRICWAANREAHIIRNAGGVVTEDALRSPDHFPPPAGHAEFILIHHTRCGMLAFTDDLLKAGLEGDANAGQLLAQATERAFASCGKCAASPAAFHAFAAPPSRWTRRPTHATARAWSGTCGGACPSSSNHAWIPDPGLRRDHGAGLRVRRRHRAPAGVDYPGADRARAG
jgi:carbonic anhydrase